MTIEAANIEGVDNQLELQVESREEKLTKLFEMEMEIQQMKSKREALMNQANAIKNDLKAKEKDKVDLLNHLNSGQETIIPVAVAVSEEEPDTKEDYPSEEELDATDYTPDTPPDEEEDSEDPEESEEEEAAA